MTKIKDLLARATKDAPLPWNLTDSFRLVMRDANGRAVGFLQEAGLTPDLADLICLAVNALPQMRAALMNVTAHLIAAHDLLLQTPKTTKMAAPSDRMFDQMLRDFEASFERGRKALAALESKP